MHTNENPHWQAGENDFTSIKTRFNRTIPDIESQFRQAMQTAGINYSGEIIHDGKLHRFHIEGHKRGSQNGAYIFHADGCPAGWFLDFKTGLSQTWRSGNAASVSYAFSEQIREAKKQRETEIFQKHEETAKKAVHIWGKSKQIANQSDHQYLVNKRIQPNGARIYGNALVIPIYNESDKLVNLQFINTRGEKRFLSGGRKRGCFHIIGNLLSKILICEGFATGASLHEDSKQRVVVAFDAGNLLTVAKNIRDLSQDSEIIICGDNDLSGVGQSKAREAALAIGGKVLIPKIPGKDWNDLIAGGREHG
ncbi:putative DNA primase/helicase [Nitrosomonas oligotropha]|uniref:Putative DNA primase/helicase n=1 Tax=Nitrosomonas oligotropha TaxID=42354 RepID=A0A2T5HYT9_9PROT|nr:toprim domain-containing protein [Nitrosomonas oligotropha]PTQ76740.1 putative DNA primase/helicase [Nitrosomonas oligotropha]